MLKGSANVTLAAGRRWVSAGLPAAVLCILTQSALTGAPYKLPSAMAKAGVLAMIRSLAVTLAGRGIRVNGIGPGLVDTPLTAGGLAVPGVRDKVITQIPLGRIGRPEDIAGAAVFLASPQPAYITGQMLYVDGGILAQQMSWKPAT